MKSKDLALLLVVAFISIVFSVVVGKLVFATPTNREQKVEVVQPISSTFPPLDTHYFNSNSVDPTQLITIGNNTNPNPFNGSSAGQ